MHTQKAEEERSEREGRWGESRDKERKKTEISELKKQPKLKTNRSSDVEKAWEKRAGG